VRWSAKISSTSRVRDATPHDASELSGPSIAARKRRRVGFRCVLEPADLGSVQVELLSFEPDTSNFAFAPARASPSLPARQG